MENSVKGYKAFNANLTNRYGASFKEGEKYLVDGHAVFGNRGNGFHFCQRLEDTLRYFDAMDGDVVFAEVIGSGDIVEYSDEYYGYYDMYASTELEIIRVLSREEIINMYLSVPSPRMVRFVQGFRLNDMEKELMKCCYNDDINVINAISYYQDGDKDVYSREKQRVYKKKINEEN